MQDDSFSLEAQLRQIKNRAAAEGVEIIKVYSDPAMLAYKNKYRPGITQMLDDARKGTFRILYVHKVDRLARRLEWALEIVKQLQKVDITLKAVEQNFDLDTPWREVEGLQMQLDALEQLTPHEVRQAGFVLENLQQAWHAATMEEKQELCQIILKQVLYDFETGEIVGVQPNAEYEVLFRVMAATHI